LSQFEGEQMAWAIEGCTGWLFVYEELARAGAQVHLAEPAQLSVKRGPKRRAKTDAADARLLRELLLLGDVPESWIPPKAVLEGRVTIRLYMDLMEERLGWIERIRATLFHQGAPDLPSLLNTRGRQALSEVDLSARGRQVVETARRQIDRLNGELAELRKQISHAARSQPACRALVQTQYGIGSLLAYAIWAEMGDPRRFSSSSGVVRFSGLDVTVYSSDGKRGRGHLSKQGSPVLRWAFYEAALAATRGGSPDHFYYRQVRGRHPDDRATKIALLSVARRVARRCYHTLRELGAEAWSEAA
jgi:transposase